MPDSDSSVEQPNALTSQSLNKLPGISHGFFTRQGGTSKGIYASLNCGPGSDDDAGNVALNRARVISLLGANDLVTLYQIHSSTALVATGPWPDNAPRPKADAIITATPGLAVGALSADCTPVLLADPIARIVAAAHSGWRGAVAGILEATIETMVNIGAQRSNITAAIGPCINQDAYEVGHDFKTTLIDLNPDNHTFFSHSDTQTKPHFDLPGFVATRLADAGLTHVEMLSRCTFQNPDLFFSYRQTCQNQEADYGRQISAIVLN